MSKSSSASQLEPIEESFVSQLEPMISSMGDWVGLPSCQALDGL